MAVDDKSEQTVEIAEPKLVSSSQARPLDLPSNPVVVLLAILVTLAVLCLAYVAAEILLPIVLALGSFSGRYATVMKSVTRILISEGLATRRWIPT